MRATAATAWVLAAAALVARAEDGRVVLAPALEAVSIAVAADGSRLAVLDRQGAVHLLDPADGTESGVLPDATPNTSVSFVGPDASFVATWGHDLCVWSVAKAKVLKRLTPPTMSAKDQKTASRAAEPSDFAAAASPRDKMVALAGADRRVSLWSAATERDVGSIASAGVGIAAGFSPDGRKLAAVLHKPGGGRLVEVYDASARSVSWKIEISDYEAMQKDPGKVLMGWNGVSFSRDAKTLYVACSQPVFGGREGEDGALRAYDLDKRKERWTRRFEGEGLRRAAAAPQAERIAVATAKGVALVDPATGATAQVLGSPDDAPLDVAFSPDGRRLFAVGGGRGVVRWDLPDAASAPPSAAETPAALTTTPVKFRAPVKRIAVSSDGTMLAAAEGDGYETSRVRRYDLAKGTLKGETALVGGKWIESLAFVGPGADLVAYKGGLEDRAEVWSFATGARSALLDDHSIRAAGADETYSISCLAASPATREVALGYTSKKSGAAVFAVLDAAGGKVLARPVLDVAGAPQPIACVFSADGLRLAVVLAGSDVALAVFRRDSPKADWGRAWVSRTDKLGGSRALWWHEVAFTSDGRFVVARSDITGSGPARAVIVIWRTDQAGDPWIGATAENNGGLGLAPSPRGDGFAVSSFDGAFLVDPETGSTTRRLPGTRTLPDGLAFSPDGRRLYAALEQELVVWDLGDAK